MARILIAEDDASMRHFLATALRRAGHDVDTASDGEDALQQIVDIAYDLLLADVVMPGMDGVELARRATDLDPELRVMFITGFAAIALSRRNVAFPHAGVVSKPFHLRDLVDQVNRLLTPLARLA